MVLRSHELPPDDFENYDDDGFEWSAAEELSSGERICAPLNEPRGSTFWPSALVIAVALMAGVAIAQFPEATTAVKTTASALLAEASPQPQPPPQAAPAESVTPQTALPPPPAATTDVAAAPGATAGEAAPPSDPVSAPSAETPPDAQTAAEAPVPAAAVEPLPKPVADPQDPNQKRALAAGLHPGVSKVLLAKMTAADFSSARLAVQTALAETEDGATLQWPRSGTAKDAKGAVQFEVKFVAGAAPDCRRYVVIVTKDRWSTTAPPMEACGAELPKRRFASKAGRSPG